VVLTFFRAKPGYVEKLLPVGERRYVSGTLQMYDGIPQIVHPDRVVDEAGFAKLSGIDPVYPLTEGLALGSLRRAIAQALQKLPDLPEWISPEVIRRCSFPPIGRRSIAYCAGRTHNILPMARSGRGWRLTNCWPGSWRWRWCARNCGARPAPPSATAIAPQDHRRAA
jgi:hypothetical protein